MNTFQLPSEKKSIAHVAKHVGSALVSQQPTETQRRRNIEYLAWLLDESIEIPGIKFRIGFDSLIGLIPGVGDVASAGLSTYIVASAARLGVPKTVLALMAFNSAVDACVGMIPVVGDLFDAVFKANSRNLNLVIESLENPQRVKRLALKKFLWTTLGVGGFVALPIALVVAGFVALLG